MAETAPKIDLRDIDAILRETRAMAPVYTPEWKADEDAGAGAALLKVFAKLLDGVIRRLNEVPTKNFVAFLEMIGIRLLPALPARVPLTFILSTGAKESVAIAARSQAAGSPPEGGDPVVFETERTILATPARLQAIFGIVPARDEVYDHTTELQGKTPVVAELFAETGKNLQEHSLFIGHDDLFQIKGNADIKLTVEPLNQSLTDSTVALWQYAAGETQAVVNGEKVKVPDWRTFERVAIAQDRIVLSKRNTDEIKKVKVNEIESCWVRCVMQKPLLKEHALAALVVRELKVAATPLSAEAAKSESTTTTSDTRSDGDTKISFAASTSPVEGTQAVSARGIEPDAAFYNDLPLKVPATTSKPLTPYGPAPRPGDVGVRPRQGDIFYLASQEALSKKGARISLLVNMEGEVGGTSSAGAINIERVHGIGKAFAARLREAGVHTITDFLSLSLTEAADIVRNRQRNIPAEQYMLKVRNMRDAAAKEFLDRKASLGIPFGSKIPGVEPGQAGGGTTSPPHRTAVTSPPETVTPILSWEYWNGKGWVGIDDVVDGTNALTEGGIVWFTCPEDLSLTKVIGQENYWIRVRIAFGDYGREEVVIDSTSPPSVHIDTSKINPPIFYSLKISYSVPGEPPTYVQTLNNLQYESHEVTEDASPVTPFSPFVALDDAAQSLYMGFDQAPLKGPISIFFSLEEQEYTEENTPRVEWEYFRRKSPDAAGEWARLPVTDGTKNLTLSGTIEFIGPEDFAQLQRFGRSLFWIRAVDVENQFKSLRGVAEDYAAQAATAPSTTSTAEAAKREKLLQQKIITLLGDRVSSPIAQAFRTRISDRLALVQRTASGSSSTASARAARSLRRAPSAAASDAAPVSASGDAPAEPPSSGPLATLPDFFALSASARAPRSSASLSTPSAQTRATTSKVDTGKLSTGKTEAGKTETGKTETCGCATPKVCAQTTETLDLHFSADAGLSEGAFAPLVKGIYLNTAWASQSETVAEEIIGSSSGVADQSFTLTRFPVIEEEIWVDELGSLTESERKAFVAGGSLKVDERKDAEGNTTAFRIRWERSDDLAEAEPTARVYTIDRTFGEIKFGDGVHGMVPPIGRDNLRASYQAGGGSRGNVAAGIITGLRTTIPFVDRVTNPEAAGGGSDTELLEKALERGPRTIKNRRRAVTVGDFEQIALEASQSVARVRALPTFNDQGEYETNWVTVIIVPASTDARPVPSPQLRLRVEKYLRERSANVSVFPAHIKVTGPAYVEVRVTADIFPRSIDLAPAVEAAAITSAEKFLHPLTGGYGGGGWEFGRLPCLSDFYSLLEAVEGVDHIENLTMTLQGVTPGGNLSGDPTVVTEEKPLAAEVPPYTLVFSGEHKFTLKPLL